MKKPLLIALVLVVVAIILGAISYALSSMSQNSDAKNTEQEIMQDQTPEDVSLAAAIRLLPDPSLVLGGQKITDNLYWIWNSEASEMGARERINTTWIVDLNKGEVVETFSRNDFYPIEPRISFPPANDDYFKVVWENGWEGPWTETTDYFDKNTGALVYTLSLNMGQEAVITSGNTELSVLLDPPGGCDDAVTDPSKQTVTVTGLNVNGASYPFPEPRTAECVLNEFLGSGFYPEFTSVSLSADGVVRISLPWEGTHATIPIPSLNPEEIAYE
jgi:hypothetical protein